MAAARMIAFLSLLLVTLALAPAAHAKRVALVIGNESYQVGPLANPVRDAQAVAAALKRLGFDTVDLRKNLDAAGMKTALRDFGGHVQGAEIALVFYAGHGTENGGTNFLIPVDARLARAIDLDLEAVRLDTVLGTLEGAAKLKVVILDACRNTLFPLAGGKRSQTRGLARIEPEDNTLVAYAAKEGTLADDGTGRTNSPFTEALLRHIETPGLEVDYVFRLVRDDVLAATARQQIPHLYGTQGRERVYFKAPEAGTATAPAPPPAAAAAPAPATDAAELARLKAEVEELRRKQAEKEQQATLVPSPRPEPAVRPEPSAPVPAKPEAPGAAADMTPGTVFRDCPECPEMVVVPAGSFTMGSSPSEIAALAKDDGKAHSEGPTRTVTIAKPLAVGKLEVTRDEFEAFVKATGHTAGDTCWTFEKNKNEERSNRSFRNPGYAQAGDHPVVCVSWDDAKAYVAWLSNKTGKGYRLLSEAEWEYATRAGTTTRYSYGNGTGDQCAYANGADQTAKALSLPKGWEYASCKDGYERTAPAGSFKPNSFGLYDMHGNVWEWVEDCYHDSYRGASDDGSAWDTACTEQKRVVRGGSWDNGPRSLRAAFRVRITTDSRDFIVGFRVARPLVPPRTL